MYKNIQGCINAKAVRLYDSNKDELGEFKKDLTSEQLKQAREHLKIVLAIRKSRKRY